MKRNRSIVAKAFGHLLLLPIIFLSFAPLSLAQQSYRNTISGFVWGPERLPVAHVDIELSNEVGQILQRTRTDGSGRYFFGGLSSGRFTIKVLPFGTNFEEQTGEVEIINIARGSGPTSDSAYKDFTLRVRKTGVGIRQINATVYAQDVPPEAKRLYDKGLEELGANRTDAGIESLLAAVKIFPEYHAALERLGREYVLKENYEYARAVYLKLVSVNERNFAGWYGLSFAAYALKEPEIAILAAEKAVALEPRSIDALIILGISQRRAKRFPDAEKTLLSAKKLANGQSADVHWNLALLYANDLHKYKEAADELESYLKVAPSTAKVDSVKKLITKLREKSRATT
ncbi:MAG: tetratricopeptide repeat protein [Pyrinomonadaceae bacterium]